MLLMQAKQSDAQELTSGQASTMARNEQVIDTLTGNGSTLAQLQLA